MSDRGNEIRMANDELPEGWVSAKISQIIASDGLFSDGDWVESKDQDPNGSIRLLQLADVGDGRFIDKSSRFVNEEKFEKLRCTEVFENDVLIARMPDPLGRACLTPKLKQKSITVVDVAIVRPGSKSVSPVWLMHWINSPEIRQLMELESTGSTRKRIARGKIGEIVLPIPPLPEQKRIADKLEAVLGRVDACRTRLDRVPALLKRFRQSVLAAAASGKLTEDWREENAHRFPSTKASHEIETDELEELPSGWIWTCPQKIRDAERYSLAIGPFGSNLKVSDYRESGVPLVFVREIRSRSFGGAKTKFVTAEKAEELKAHAAFGGDLLITKMGDPPGDVAIYPINAPQAIITADCIKLRVDAIKAETAFVGYVIESPQARARLLDIVAGVAQQKISLERFRDFPIQLAPLPEQTEIVRRVEALFALADRIEARLTAAQKTVERLTPATLAKAFRGELVPQDPNDEPAAVLLERIAGIKDLAPVKKARAKRPPRA